MLACRPKSFEYGNFILIVDLKVDVVLSVKSFEVSGLVNR
jgi:hypothetical protein